MKVHSWRTLSLLVVVLFISALYLYVFPSPTLIYIGVVLLHAGVGVLAVLFLIPRLLEIVRRRDLGWLFITGGAATGIVLLIVGTPRPFWNWMYAHIGLSFAGVAFLAARWVGSKGWLAGGNGAALLRYGVCLVLVAILGIGGWRIRQSRWQSAHVINNPVSPPASMEGE